jgi:hypothetical protein
MALPAQETQAKVTELEQRAAAADAARQEAIDERVKAIQRVRPPFSPHAGSPC